MVSDRSAPAVIARKNSYANGSDDGAETQAILMSVFRTLRQRGHNPVSAVSEAVRAYLQGRPITAFAGADRWNRLKGYDCVSA